MVANSFCSFTKIGNEGREKRNGLTVLTCVCACMCVCMCACVRVYSGIEHDRGGAFY